MKKIFLHSLFSLTLFCSGFVSAFDKETTPAPNVEHIAQEATCQGYDQNFVELIEMLYGPGFLSQGGERSVQDMIGNLNLDNLQVLDIGSGLGGPSIYLAKKYDAHIVGLEPQEWMIQQAKKNLKRKEEDLKGSVDFVQMEHASHLQQFPDASFDVIFSKEALLHVPIELKASFFSEIYRVLKPGGQIILMDWMHSSEDYTENTKKMMELDGVAYNLVTPDDYSQILESVGFSEISCSDTTLESYDLSQKNVHTLLALESKIKKKYDSDTFQDSLDSWSWQRDAFCTKELRTGIFKARKL